MLQSFLLPSDQYAACEHAMDLCSHNLAGICSLDPAFLQTAVCACRPATFFADLERGRVMDILLFPFTPPAQNGQGAMQKVGGKLEKEAGREKG